MKFFKRNKSLISFIFLIVLAASLRFAGIQWGLPHLYNADEPHIINLAVSFGRGSLRPYAFKYPTLWPYFLFICYGFYFLIWSHFGTIHSLIAFAGLYGWNPIGFYLIARIFAALFSLLAVYVLYRENESRAEFGWAWIFAAFSPLLIYAAHEAKGDALMFFFVCLGWHYALKVFEGGKRRDHRLSALFFGLAFSSQFTALPAVIALFCANFFSPRKPPRFWIFEGGILFAVAFLMGSPYALLDFHNFWFWIHMHSPTAMDALAPWSRWGVTKHILRNLRDFFGLGFLAAFLAALGLFFMAFSNPALLAVLVVPVFFCLTILVNNPDGGTPRYLVPMFPALAFLASQGLCIVLSRKNKILSRVLFSAFILLIFVPSIERAAALDREMRLPDTRLLSEKWIFKHIPQGAVLLADEPSTGPRLFMVQPEIEQLAERTQKAGSPRSRLYFAMAKTDPGGGYWIYRIKRSAWDLDVHHPLQVQLSQADSPMLDVIPGLKIAQKAGVQYVITSSIGVNLRRAPELIPFFDQLKKKGILLREFDPIQGKIAGPAIKIYRIVSASPKLDAIGE